MISLTSCVTNSYTRASVATNVMVGAMYLSGLQLGVTCKAGQSPAAGLAAAAGRACGRAGGVRRDCCVAAAAMPLDCRARLHAPGQPVAGSSTSGGSKHDAVKGALSIPPLTHHLKNVAVDNCTA